MTSLDKIHTNLNNLQRVENNFVQLIVTILTISDTYSPKFGQVQKMANSLILAGFGMAVLGMSGRIAARSAPRAISNIENLIKSMPLQNWSKAWANSKYYKGGFQLKMTRREVSRNN